MKNEGQRIVVYSTYSDDVLLSEGGEVISVQSGGPAFFIDQSLQKHSFRYKIISGERARVQIRITDRGEFGRVDPISPNAAYDSDATTVLISTILNEWPISVVKDGQTAFVDIQGYVRDGDIFGKKKLFVVPKEIKPFCIKGTEAEINYLPVDFLNDQRKNRCLVVTKGSRGAELFYRGERFTITPPEVVDVRDSVGAGDTFFAHFFAYYLATQDIELSGESAAQEVVTFLNNKKNGQI